MQITINQDTLTALENELAHLRATIADLRQQKDQLMDRWREEQKLRLAGTKIELLDELKSRGWRLTSVAAHTGNSVLYRCMYWCEKCGGRWLSCHDGGNHFEHPADAIKDAIIRDSQEAAA